MIFVDASAWYAKLGTGTEQHAEAERLWPQLRREGMCTSAVVLYEVAELLCRRAGPAQAHPLIRQLLTTTGLTVYRPGPAEELLATDLLRDLARKPAARGVRPVGFRDCLSFAIMRINRLKQAYSYDRHFAQAGFAVWPASR